VTSRKKVEGPSPPEKSWGLSSPVPPPMDKKDVQQRSIMHIISNS